MELICGITSQSKRHLISFLSIQVLAIATRYKTIEEANAEAEAKALIGEAQAYVINLKGKRMEE